MTGYWEQFDRMTRLIQLMKALEFYPEIDLGGHL